MAVGNFDGVHRGHAALAKRLTARAREAGGPAVVLTFDPHPIQLLRPESAQPPLTTMERRAELLGVFGVDVVIAYPTDAALLALSPEAFFETIVVNAIGAAAMVEGPNFFFGKDRAGDVTLLKKLCETRGMTLEVLTPHMEGEQMASSSRVRRAIEQGDLELAASLLTAPYRITGKVITGDRRGRTIGFPTANLSDIETLLPKPGVYAAQARAAGGVFPSAVNIGSRPTFGDAKISVEAHLIGFSGDLYGEQVDLDLVTRLREIQPFGTIEDLKSQLAIDVAHAKEAVLNRESRGPLAQL